LLRGLSHKEIAALRGTSEAAVRQQAHIAYDKAGLKGRAAFCAYFLEDLLPSADKSAASGNGSDVREGVPLN
jgi:DNA-binding NarL/FixJ family response regulator